MRWPVVTVAVLGSLALGAPTRADPALDATRAAARDLVSRLAKRPAGVGAPGADGAPTPRPPAEPRRAAFALTNRCASALDPAKAREVVAAAVPGVALVEGEAPFGLHVTVHSFAIKNDARKVVWFAASVELATSREEALVAVGLGDVLVVDDKPAAAGSPEARAAAADLAEAFRLGPTQLVEARAALAGWIAGLPAPKGEPEAATLDARLDDLEPGASEDLLRIALAAACLDGERFTPSKKEAACRVVVGVAPREKSDGTAALGLDLTVVESGKPVARLDVSRILGEADDRVPGAVEGGTALEAKVVAVDPARARVRLTVGADDKVARGASFAITRGVQRLARVQVVLVLGDSCWCRVVAVEPEQAVQAGDSAKLLIASK